MRLAAFLAVGLVGSALWASPAAAMPAALQPPAVAVGPSDVIQAGGRCGPFAHWVPGHRNRYGRWVPPHCRHFHHHHHHHHHPYYR